MYVEWPSKYITRKQNCLEQKDTSTTTVKELINRIRQGTLEHIKSKLCKNLGHGKEICDTCQSIAKEPITIRVGLLNEDRVFNRTVDMDLMKINKATVLHVVDKGKKFGATIILNVESIEKV